VNCLGLGSRAVPEKSSGGVGVEALLSKRAPLLSKPAHRGRLAGTWGRGWGLAERCGGQHQQTSTEAPTKATTLGSADS
jgi:hypothetical protein